MFRICLAALSVLFAAATASAFSSAIFDNGAFLPLIRRDHPRLFLTPEEIPRLREMARTRWAERFAAIQREVDAYPPDAPVIFDRDRFTERPDGSIRLKKPGTHGHMLFRYNGAYQASRAALVYLVTGERRYLELAKNYLRLYAYVLEWTGETAKCWVDWDGVTRVNALVAYDWIAADLTPAERRELLLPILRYLRKSAPDGVYKFRRTSTVDPLSGWYGEGPMQWYAGLAAWGDGVDDAEAEKMLRYIAPLFRDTMDARDRISAGSGLLVALTGSYSFGPYPHASTFFFHTCRSALGLADAAQHWSHMCDYPYWFDWAKIRYLPGARILTYGIGDAEHKDNVLGTNLIYSHLAQGIHFYGRDPDRSAAIRAVLSQLPKDFRTFSSIYPFLPFVLFDFDPADIPETPLPAASGRYFYNPEYGLLIVRSGIGPDDTYAAFRFGSRHMRHQHYDELHFVIYKHDFLALDSGSRTSNRHHQYYAPQTVAHNSLLIHQEKETVPYFWKPWGMEVENEAKPFCHGGQNSNERGRALALQSRPYLIYAAGDATACYAPEKCRLAVRQWVWLKPDLFVIYDRVESVKPEQKKEFLLHFLEKPEPVAPGVWRADAGKGRLFLRTLLPESAAQTPVGGPGREFFASGRNWALPGGDAWEKTYQLAGKWRLEVAPPTPAAKATFLHLLQATDTGVSAMIPAKLEQTAAEDILSLTDPAGNRWKLAFGRSHTSLRFTLTDKNGQPLANESLPTAIEPQPPRP